MPSQDLLPPSVPALREPAAVTVAPTWWDVNTADSGRKLSHYLFIFRRHLWKMVAFVVVVTLLTLVISLRLTPVYESTATVDIDRRMPTGIVGQDAVQPFSNDADQYLATQMRLIESDSVLRPVALRYNLAARDKGWFAEWLGEESFDPEAPVELEDFSVRRPPNTYLLQISYRSEDRQLAANVANDIAHSYLEHTYKIRYQAASGLSRYMEKQLEELRAKMEQSSGALAKFEQELSIVSPEEKTNILSARLMELNSEYTKAQAERVAREAAYGSVQSGLMEAAQASTQGDSLRKLTEEFNTARQHFAEVRSHFGPNHPEYKTVAAHLEELETLLSSTRQAVARTVKVEYEEALSRERMLAAAVAEAKSELDNLNARSFEYQSLKREAEGNKQLYEELLRKIKEATINSSFQDSSARIANLARPSREPDFPNIPVNTLLAFLLSCGLACAAAISADYLDNTIRDPEQVAQTMNTQVIGTLPMVKSWRGKFSLASALKTSASGPASGSAPDPTVSSYGEAIRTLRNSILLSDFDNRIRSLLITSASPGEGKSTTALHLAVAHATQGNRTLLIDGDLRRPSVHRRFGLTVKKGLSTILLNKQPWREAIIHPDGNPNLDILPAGPSSRQAADLVGQSLVELLVETSQEYDLVILDAPPLLGFAEPLQMATATDGVIVVTRAGETNRKAVVSVINTLTRIRANLVGLVLNEVHRQVSDGYYYYSYYRKYYTDRPHDGQRQDKEVA